MKEIWDEALASIRARVTDENYATYFRPLRFGRLEDDGLVLEVDDPFFGDWVQLHYRDLIDAAVRDAAGRPLGRRFERRWAVRPADRARVAPERWVVTAPPVGSIERLTVQLDAPVDRLLLAERVNLRDPRGQAVSGTVQISPAGDRWSLAPDEPWSAGAYALEVDVTLEDHAGNSVAGPFDRPADVLLRVFDDGVMRRPIGIGGR